ncbi:MAG: DMT family protein [bacterium]|nr:DMT family protein [bacterium]
MLRISTVFLLICSNLFMNYAWYGHLKDLRTSPLWIAILASWGIALLEYSLQVPANRIGFAFFSLPQLKIMQEIITLIVFALFCIFYMKQKITYDFLWAGICLFGAAWFMFRHLAAVR